MWMTALIDFCLAVNLLITIVMFLLVTEPEAVVLWARRRMHSEDTWFDEQGLPERDGVAMAKVWAKWMWVVLFAWGLLTGFLVGLYWHGWFWRF